MLKQLIRSMTCFLLFGISSATLAMQVLPMMNNGQANLKISNHDYTRIFVNNDRIRDVKGLSGQYDIKSDTRLGQIYMIPSNPKKSFNVFVITENDQTYQLMMTPAAITADSIELDPVMINTSIVPDHPMEPTSNAYQLIRDMYFALIPLGYSIKQPWHFKKYLGNNISVQLLKTYSDHSFTGIMDLVTNMSKQPIQLTEQEFMQPGVKAVMIEHPYLAAHETTHLYKVIDHE